MKALVIALLLIAQSASAQPFMTGEEFDELSLGTTMYFTEGGAFFGSEQFLPNQRTVWRAEDGTCVNGKWAEADGNICFIYDNGDGPHCWNLSQNGEELTITSTTQTPELPPLVLQLSGQDTVPIICTGPAFGV